MKTKLICKGLKKIESSNVVTVCLEYPKFLSISTQVRSVVY